MKFSGKNFQPWPEFDLDISGLTILIGPSNEGKSSIYRALKGILRNEIQPAHIRDPKNEPLELTIEVNGYTVSARRSKKGSVHYVVNHPSFDKPKEYAKLDEDVPPEIKDWKFGEIEIGEFSFDPIFGDQNKAQFLIDPTAFKPGPINAILGAFGGTEKLEAGKKEANLRKTQKDGEARMLAGQIREAEERKAKLDGMIVQGEEISKSVKGLEDEITLLEEESFWYGEALTARRKLAPLQEIGDALILPDITGIEQLQQQAQYLEQAAESSAFARWLDKPLRAITDITAPWAECVALWKQVRAISDTASLEGSEVDVAGLKALSELNTQFNDLLVLQSSIRHLDTATLLRRELKESAASLADIESQLAAVHEELAALQAEARKGMCEKCGKPLEHICQ
jgi:exonuclease SbcC